MKHAFIILLCLITFTATAKVIYKYILTTGTTGYVTIQFPPPTGSDSLPQDYNRAILQARFRLGSLGDTQMAVYECTGGTYIQLIPYTTDTNYQVGNSSNVNFPSGDSLYRWVRHNMNNSN